MTAIGYMCVGFLLGAVWMALMVIADALFWRTKQERDQRRNPQQKTTDVLRYERRHGRA